MKSRDFFTPVVLGLVVAVLVFKIVMDILGAVL